MQSVVYGHLITADFPSSVLSLNQKNTILSQPDAFLFSRSRSSLSVVYFQPDCYNTIKSLAILEHPEVAAELRRILTGYILDGRSTPGPKQKNNGQDVWDAILWIREDDGDSP